MKKMDGSCIRAETNTETVIPMVVGALATVSKGLEKRKINTLERIKTIQTTLLLKSDRIVSRVLEI